MHLGPDGPRIGELDEEMVHETKPGDVVTLGASSWRALEITRDRVIVAPAPGEAGRLPFWRGDGPGRPIELGQALGRFTRELLEHGSRDAAAAQLAQEHGLDEYASKNLLDYLEAQREWTGSCPTDRRITLERFRDELGDWRICILSPFGSRIHAPWAMAIASRLAERGSFDAQPLWTDDGLMFRFADADRLPPTDLFLPDPDEIEERVTDQLSGSALFASQFRENAARALLLPRRRPGARTPLWAQRLRSQNLQAVASGFPDFPIMLETYRSCLQDVFDLPGLAQLMEGIRSRAITVDDVETPSASPFARSLVFSYTATYLYQLDMPAAERRTQALSLDRHMLRELLGAEALRELLDHEVIDLVEARRQGVDPELRARHADGLHDTLRRVGDLDEQELLARFEGSAASLGQAVAELESARRVIHVEIAGSPRVVAAEDAALYRDALGVSLPEALPAAFLEPAKTPLEQLVMRYARTHGPFETTSIATRFGLIPGQLEPLLVALATQGKLVEGEFDPRGSGREWCEPEILRRIKRGTLEKLRSQVSPVEGDVLARFLVDWHGIGTGRKGESRLDEAIDLLEGLPLSFAELERSILPARVPDFEPRMLDERGAQGQLVWVGSRALGERDGRVALYRRANIAALLDPPRIDPMELEEGADARPGESAQAVEGREGLGRVARLLLEKLEARGASFFSELAQGIAVESSDEIVKSALGSGLAWSRDQRHRRADSRAGSPAASRPASRSSRATVDDRWSLVIGRADARRSALRDGAFACAHSALSLATRNRVARVDGDRESGRRLWRDLPGAPGDGGDRSHSPRLFRRGHDQRAARRAGCRRSAACAARAAAAAECGAVGGNGSGAALRNAAAVANAARSGALGGAGGGGRGARGGRRCAEEGRAGKAQARRRGACRAGRRSPRSLPGPWGRAHPQLRGFRRCVGRRASRSGGARAREGPRTSRSQPTVDRRDRR